MEKTIWLSYDLGVRGDYSSIYRWLDEVKAVECGDSLAYVKVNMPEGISPPDYIKKELEANVTFSKSDRVYVIWKDPSGSNKGRFILGKRKASPWLGFASTSVNEDDA